MNQQGRLLLASEHGKTPDSLSQPRCQFIMLMFLVYFYKVLDNICCLRAQIKCVPYALTKEAAWDISDEQDTKHQQWTNKYVHDASSTKTALAGTCLTNERRKKLQMYFVRRLLVSAILGFSKYAIMKKLNIDQNKWQDFAMNRSKQRS